MNQPGEHNTEVPRARVQAAAALQDIFLSVSKGERVRDSVTAMVDAFWSQGRTLEAKMLEAMLRGGYAAAKEFLNERRDNKKCGGRVFVDGLRMEESDDE